MRSVRALAACAALLCAALPAVATAQDSEAPPHAAAHWIPMEPWVTEHWLPYDEGRLYELLGVARQDIWNQLRDDRHTIAELARSRGLDPPRLAAALVAPRRGSVSRRRLAVLRSRALRTLTQGHLAQHIFFHSLHQFSVPRRAPEIFGTSSMREFQRLRRTELSPLQIAEMHGRSTARVHELVVATLRASARRGVRTRATTARQSAILLGRQLSQVPRWLQQSRYNGPPKTRHGRLVAPPRNYASNPAVSADGRHVVFESYEQRLPLAVRDGEISVRWRDLERADAELVNPQTPGDPASAYNAAVSGDGVRIAYETSRGNLNFAKRYGGMRVTLRDRATGELVEVSHPAGSGATGSAYNASISADGSRVAFEAARPADAPGATGEVARLFVRDLSTGATFLASRADGPDGAAPDGPIYEGSLSGDGGSVVFTSAAPNLGAATSGGRRTAVFARDLGTGRTTAVSPAHGWSSDGSISADGRLVAFARSARAGTPPRVFVRDLVTGSLRQLSRGTAWDPVIASGGERVAFVAPGRGGRLSVYVHELATGHLALVSRASGRSGRSAGGISMDPSLSADGRVVAFTSTATGLDRGKPDDRRGVFIRETVLERTRLVAAGEGAPAAAAMVCSLDG